MPKHRFNPFEELGVDVPRGTRQAALEELRDFLHLSVLADVDSSTSPVDGTRFRRLSPEYRKKKLGMGGSGRADLRLTEQMLNAYDVKVKGGVLEAGTYGGGKAEKKSRGHNQHPGDEHPFLPVRRFVPAPGQSYRRGLEKQMRAILKEYL